MSVLDLLMPKPDETIHIDLDKRPIVATCFMCGRNIHGRGKMISGDASYQIDGLRICRNCLQPYANMMWLVTEDM